VWVDPLDGKLIIFNNSLYQGTLNYTKGDLDAVTTLIGLSHKNRPIMGNFIN